MKPFFITIEGVAELIKDKSKFEEHWTKDLDAWFKEGVDTPGLTLIKVVAKRLHYWDGWDFRRDRTEGARRSLVSLEECGSPAHFGEGEGRAGLP